MSDEHPGRHHEQPSTGPTPCQEPLAVSPLFSQVLTTLPRKDTILIAQIANAFVEAVGDQMAMDTLTLTMDLMYCHGGICPLDLQRMVEDITAGHIGSIGHDIAGIVRHLDRATGALTQGFLPRYALSQ